VTRRWQARQIQQNAPASKSREGAD
jgi:hypothetical protein